LWPNFFIVGAQKAGTTSLHEYLKNIPGIYMSPFKEPNFFSISVIRDDDPLEKIRDEKAYLDLFKKVKNEKIIGEASPFYLTDPETPSLIHKVSPDAKILISLRDPVDRMFSHILQEKRRRNLEGSFRDHLMNEIKLGDKSWEYFAIKHGKYADNVQRYLDTFGNKNVKIIIFEEFVKNTEESINDILRFLGINYKLDNFKAERYNAYFNVKPRGRISTKILKNKTVHRITTKLIPQYGRKFLKEKILLKKDTEKPKLLEEDKKILKDIYENDVRKLKKILKKELPWKNF
jgi:hypothetical protein